MLDFFRRYQRFFFLLITIVIIISFSFFGTYSTLSNQSYHTTPAFTDVEGKTVSRAEMEEMVTFLGTDNEDKLLFGGVWGPNFLNDGVIKKDFLATGLAAILANAYRQELAPDFDTRLEKEKRYMPYEHPQGRFVSAASAWAYFAPEIKSQWEALRSQKDLLSEEALEARARLFLAERAFPSQMLKQVLKFQQQQYNWLMPDPNLDQMDLSLFGYHTVEDWFGPRFVRLIAQFIMNSAKLAEKQGYQVSRDEALADLLRLSKLSFEQNHNSPFLGLSNSDEYLQEQLRRMGMDQSKAISLWRQVLLFRRLFHDFGNGALVDTDLYKKFLDYTHEYVDIDLYRLPGALQMRSFKDLQRLEIYLQSVSPKKDKLKLPTEFLSHEEIEKRAPELVQKKYFVEMAGIDKQQLQSKVGVKDMWNWELDEGHWKTLLSQFPELASKNTSTRDERFAFLDQLDSKTRAKIDQVAREAIVEAHPEWLSDALATAPLKKMTLGIRKQGGKVPMEGVTDSEALAQWLDAAPLASNSEEKGEVEMAALYTPDHRHYYRIRVLDRAAQPEVLSFAEAAQEGALDTLIARLLEEAYPTLRSQNPKIFQNKDLSWKPFADVQEAVAQLYFAPVLKALQENGKNEQPPDQLAHRRLYSYMLEAQKAIQQNPSAGTAWYTSSAEEKTRGLTDQWKLEKITQRLERTSKEMTPDLEKGFAMTIQEWSPIAGAADGSLFFFQLNQKGAGMDDKSLLTKVFQGHQLLSTDAQQMLMYKVLGELQERKALSLDFMKKNEEG